MAIWRPVSGSITRLDPTLASVEQIEDFFAERRIIADGSPDQLRRLDFGQAEVRWSDGAQRHVHATSDATGFLRELLSEGGRVEDLEVRRATLEDAYIGLVRQAEGGTATDVQRNTLAILDAAGEGSLA